MQITAALPWIGARARNLDASLSTSRPVAVMEAEGLDDLLVERVLKGERHCFDLLVRKYQSRVIAAVARFVRDRTECEDIAQEVFMRAYRALASFRGDSSFYTWLFKIAVNAARNFLAANGRRPVLADLDTQVADQLDDPTRLRDRSTPEKELMREQLENSMLEALSELPAEMRTALTLREVDGLSYEDIAKTLDCPIGTVRSRIFRGREAIDKRVRPLLQE
jgi:RNA polymerase sigma-70 factor (ECF subfamily)